MTYKIVRFFEDSRPREDRERGLTLAEAQAHCQDESTHGEGWFDGYTTENDADRIVDRIMEQLKLEAS